MTKQAFVFDTILGGGIGSALGGYTSPKDHRAEGIRRGGVVGGTTGMGFGLGTLAGAGTAMHEAVPLALKGDFSNIDWKTLATRGLAGGAVGGGLGYLLGRRSVGQPSWTTPKPKDPKQEALMQDLAKKVITKEDQPLLNEPTEKVADLLPTTQLQPHQQSLVDEVDETPIRKLLMHQLGSGKSLSSIALAERKQKPYTAIVPAALRENFRKELDKFTDKKTPVDVLSYNAISKGFPLDKPDTVIADEASRLRNEKSKQTKSFQRLANKAENLILLSGTPIVNRPNELAPIISALTKKQLTSEDFDKKFLGTKTIDPGFMARNWLKPWEKVDPVEVPDVANEDELKQLLQGHVDYYKPDNPPVGSTREDVPVEMSEQQTMLWRGMYNKLPWILKWKMKNNFPLSNKELSSSLHFLNGPRQVSLSTYPYLKSELKSHDLAFQQSAKLQKAMGLLQDRFKDPRQKALIFSNFPDAGLSPYSNALTKANIPNAIFHGGLNDKQRKQLVEDYNSDKLRAALIGPAGTEGLSFKGTNLIQVLDPHWNAARVRQSEGRGLRHDSHWHLPEDLQNVHIQRFISRLPAGLKERQWRKFTNRPIRPESLGRATDDYLINLALQKDELNQKFMNILQDIGTKK